MLISIVPSYQIQLRRRVAPSGVAVWVKSTDFRYLMTVHFSLFPERVVGTSPWLKTTTLTFSLSIGQS